MSGRLPPTSQDNSFNHNTTTQSNHQQQLPSTRNTTARAAQQQQSQSPWQASSARQFTRRGVTPISTASSGQPLSTNSATSSPSRATFSPTRLDAGQTASIVNRQVASRQSSTSSTHSFGGISAAGQQQHYASATSLSGPRTRTVTSGSSPRVTSPIAGVSSLSQAGITGVGASRLSRHSPSISLSTAGSPISSSGPYSASSLSGQLTSLVVTQLNILLSTIKDDGDRVKWQAQVDKIQKLVEDNGMEVFPQYFRRLLQNNAAAIFPGNARQSETGTAGNYQLLVQEMQKITTEAQQASKIAEALDTNEGDLFRDFDLYALVDHFRLDPLAKVTLALACRKASKSDLKSKGMIMCSS